MKSIKLTEENLQTLDELMTALSDIMNLSVEVSSGGQLASIMKTGSEIGKIAAAAWGGMSLMFRTVSMEPVHLIGSLPGEPEAGPDLPLEGGFGEGAIRYADEMPGFYGRAVRMFGKGVTGPEK